MEEMVKSLCAQDRLPDVVAISYSNQHNINIHVKELLEKYLQPLGVRYIVLHQPQRLYQFEHLRCIYDHVLAHERPSEKNVWITFCDDDDMLHRKRIQKVSMVAEREKDVRIIRCLFYITEEQKWEEAIGCEDLSISHWSEFGCYSCKWEVLAEFLGNIKEYSNQNDLYFMASNRDGFFLEEPLYYHRRCLFEPNMHIWSIKKELTETMEFVHLVDAIYSYANSLEPPLYIVDIDNQIVRHVDNPETFANYWIWEWLEQEMIPTPLDDFLLHMRQHSTMKQHDCYS